MTNSRFAVFTVSLLLTGTRVLAATTDSTRLMASSAPSFDHDYGNYETYVAIFSRIADRPHDPCQGFDENGPESSICTDVLEKTGFNSSSSSAVSVYNGSIGLRWWSRFKGIFFADRSEKCWADFNGLLFRRCPNIMDFNAFMEMAERLLDCAHQDPEMKKKHKMLISGTTMMLVIPGLCQTHLSLDIRRILYERLTGALERVTWLEDITHEDRRELGRLSEANRRLEDENTRLVSNSIMQQRSIDEMANMSSLLHGCRGSLEQASDYTSSLQAENRQLARQVETLNQTRNMCEMDRNRLVEQKEFLEISTRRLEREIHAHIELRREFDRSWFGLGIHLCDSLYGFSLNVFEGSKDRLTLIVLTFIIAVLIYKISKRSFTRTKNDNGEKQPFHRGTRHRLLVHPPSRPPSLPPFQRSHRDDDENSSKPVCIGCDKRPVAPNKRKYCNICRP